ncbi:MAG: molybdopterin-dependent oxidoreductase [Prochloraceae cyanobacterium]|nr:molybdopterin-dependent oxidoreductase [Prochloraceae cyanobacterium]
MKRIDAAYHVRGEAEYVDDLPQPAEMLYAAVFASTVARGKILALNLKEALALDGIVAVFAASDIPGTNQWGSIIPDWPLLAKDEVDYAGQPVAVVVAKTKVLAQKAAHKIAMQVKELPAIVDPKEAFLRGQIIGVPRTFVLGDVARAWSNCDLIVEGNCEIGGQEHLYLETQRARAIPLEGQTMRVYSATQNPYAVQKTIAEMLNLPHHAIEVDVKRLGGAFGGKEEQATHWACLAALAAWHLDKPVELVLSRLDDLKMTGKRHPYSSDFKIGVTKEGKIIAYEVKHYQNAGAYADLSTAVLERTLFHSTNAYFIPNVQIFGVSCRTNLPPSTALRGFGGPQAMFVIESAITQIAEKLGVEREEIQRKNLLRAGDFFPYGQQMQTNSVRLTWLEAEQNYHLAEIKNRVADYNASHFEIKKGYALMPICFGISFTATFLNQGSALVHVYTDGSVSVTTGGVEMGQGLSTKIAAIASRAFGIGIERIKIETTNTTRIANMPPTAASVTTDLNGNATLLAIAQILDRLKVVAAKELRVSEPERIAFADEKVLYAGESTNLSWAGLLEKAFLFRTNLSAHAFYATPGIQFDRALEKGHPFAYHICGTALVEVTLDCLRGTYEIDSVKIVHELGRSVNEMVDLGQVEGGLAQGLGWMTIEDLRFSDSGQLLSLNLATYKIPDVYFMPDEIAIKFLTQENPLGPYGSKAVGEPPLMYGIGAFFAIRQAMRAFQPTSEFAFNSPLTPERVLCQLYQKEFQEMAQKTAVNFRSQIST